MSQAVIPVRRKSGERLLRFAAPLAVAVMFLGAWQAFVTLNAIPPYIVPSPALVAHTLYADRSLLAESLGVTMQIALIALVLATFAGVATALVFAQSRIIEMSFFPYAILLQVTPIVAIAPLIIIWVRDTRIALVLCAAVVAEFVAGTGGQGAGLAYQILLAGIQLNIPRLFAALTLIALAGVVMFAATVALSKLALARWHESELRRDT